MPFDWKKFATATVKKRAAAKAKKKATGGREPAGGALVDQGEGGVVEVGREGLR